MVSSPIKEAHKNANLRRSLGVDDLFPRSSLGLIEV